MQVDGAVRLAGPGAGLDLPVGDERAGERLDRRAADADRSRQLDWIWATLGQFPEDIRETAVLVLAQQLSHGEVAAILGVKESTVSWRMHELRKTLKQRADEER